MSSKALKRRPREFGARSYRAHAQLPAIEVRLSALPTPCHSASSAQSRHSGSLLQQRPHVTAQALVIRRFPRQGARPCSRSSNSVSLAPSPTLGSSSPVAAPRKRRSLSLSLPAGSPVRAVALNPAALQTGPPEPAVRLRAVSAMTPQLFLDEALSR